MVSLRPRLQPSRRILDTDVRKAHGQNCIERGSGRTLEITTVSRTAPAVLMNSRRELATGSFIFCTLFRRYHAPASLNSARLPPWRKGGLQLRGEGGRGEGAEARFPLASPDALAKGCRTPARAATTNSEDRKSTRL